MSRGQMTIRLKLKDKSAKYASFGKLAIFKKKSNKKQQMQE